LGLAVDLLAGIPSIVMGLFGFVLIVSLRRTFLPQGTTCLLLASFCLALLVLPSLVAGTRTALETLPERLFLTTAALGFSYGQMVRWILLPAAGQGILGGVMLAMGRAAEDTAVIMMTGVVANAGLPSGFTAKFEALPFRIYYTAAQYADQQELQLGFGTALVLLCLSGSLLFCAWVIQRRWERRWKGIRK
jgi:phosphate transport system permease protein